MYKSLLAFTLLIALSGRAQSDKYMQAMQKNVAMIDTTHSIDGLQSLAGTFDRIGDAEKTQWPPYYYAALTQSWIGWIPACKAKDATSPKITAYLAKAEAIKKTGELYA